MVNMERKCYRLPLGRLNGLLLLGTAFFAEAFVMYYFWICLQSKASAPVGFLALLACIFLMPPFVVWIGLSRTLCITSEGLAVEELRLVRRFRFFPVYIPVRGAVLQFAWNEVEEVNIRVKEAPGRGSVIRSITLRGPSLFRKRRGFGPQASIGISGATRGIEEILETVRQRLPEQV